MIRAGEAVPECSGNFLMNPKFKVSIAVQMFRARNIWTEVLTFFLSPAQLRTSSQNHTVKMLAPVAISTEDAATRFARPYILAKI